MIKQYKCPRCGRTTFAEGVIPKCKGTKKKEKHQKKEMKEVLK